jgi:hypothetical protein
MNSCSIAAAILSCVLISMNSSSYSKLLQYECSIFKMLHMNAAARLASAKVAAHLMQQFYVQHNSYAAQ